MDKEVEGMELPNETQMSYAMFVNDTFLITLANISGVSTIIMILNTYREARGVMESHKKIEMLWTSDRDILDWVRQIPCMV